jgi:flagellar secretion chaperone FliS
MHSATPPAYANTASKYREQEIQSATREQILIMLFEAAIRFCLGAKIALGKNNIEQLHNELIKAQRIIVEFMTSLDTQANPQVANNLYNLYEYLHYRLVQANIKQDPAMIEEVIGHLRALKQTWEEAIVIAQGDMLTGRTTVSRSA